MDSLELYAQVQECIRAQVPHVLVTLVGVRGSAPQDVGAKMVVTHEGLLCGTVGGGKVEATAIVHAQNMIVEHRPHELCTWNLQKDINMTCGGEVQLFFEGYFVDPWNICIFGAGHVAQSLIPLLIQLDAQVLCVDSRPEWLNRLPTALNLKTVCISDPVAAIELVPEGAFVAMMTKGHSTDAPLLTELFRSGKHCPYVGMIGSAVKAKRVKTELTKVGVDSMWLQQLRSPIGLSFGSNHTVEIAISIAGELLTVRDAQQDITDDGRVHP